MASKPSASPSVASAPNRATRRHPAPDAAPATREVVLTEDERRYVGRLLRERGAIDVALTHYATDLSEKYGFSGPINLSDDGTTITGMEAG